MVRVVGDAGVFYGTGLHGIRLGHLAHHQGRYNLTVADQPDGTLRGFNLRGEDYSLLRDLDPAEVDRRFSSEEQAILLTLEEKNAFRFFRDGDPLETLDIVPVARATVNPVSSSDDGYMVQVDGHEPFLISALGSRLFVHFAQAVPVGDAVSRVLSEIQSTAAGRNSIRDVEDEEHRPFVDILTDEAFALIRDLVRVGAFTFEPKK